MKHKLGTVCIALGTALLLGALSLFLLNSQEARNARDTSDAHLEQLVKILETAEEARSQAEVDGSVMDELPLIPEELQPTEAPEMTETIIDGNAYIGYLSMPTLELELPILSGWDYDLLRIAPCRYHGTLQGNDLVLMGHNYTTHFGPIARLEVGDPVFFADMDGGVTQYRVVAQDVLQPYAVDEMTAGLYDLTLFTCTYGGKSRVTVYCNRES